MNGVRYEYITQSNQHLINNVLDDVFDYPIKSNSLKSFLNQKNHHLLCAFNDKNQLIGFVSFVELYHPDKDTQIFVNELSVHESYQRMKIGTYLMNQVFTYAKDQAYYVWVATEMDNVEAIDFYLSLEPKTSQKSVFFDWEI